MEEHFKWDDLDVVTATDDIRGATSWLAKRDWGDSENPAWEDTSMEEKVWALLQEGYEPIGGLTVRWDEGDQALYKYQLMVHRGEELNENNDPMRSESSEFFILMSRLIESIDALQFAIDEDQSSIQDSIAALKSEIVAVLAELKEAKDEAVANMDLAKLILKFTGNDI